MRAKKELIKKLVGDDLCEVPGCYDKTAQFSVTLCETHRYTWCHKYFHQQGEVETQSVWIKFMKDQTIDED